MTRRLGAWWFGDHDADDAFDAGDLHPRQQGGQRYLTEMAVVLRAAGLNVVEVDGWQYRSRNSGGYDANRPWCVMWHHTASDTTPDNDVNYIVSGSDDAPIANLYIDRDGTVWVCAGGATNTNGKGGPFEVSRGVIPADSMNTHAVGIEMANNGVGQPWPQQQIDAAFTTSLAITNWLGLSPIDVCVHHVWAPDRKIDPATAAAVQGPWQPSATNTAGSWSMDDLYDELIDRHNATPPPNPSKDDNMYLATLSDGTIVVVGSSVRPVSGDEIAPGGPYVDLPRYTPQPDSYWHMWLRAGSDEYSQRMGMS